MAHEHDRAATDSNPSAEATEEIPIGDDWIEAFTTKELSRKRRLKIETAQGEIAVFWLNDCPHAMANICVHSERELVKGQIFDNRVVCPGHQWAFDVDTGYCKERDRYQPIHDTVVKDGMVHVRLTPRN